MNEQLHLERRVNVIIYLNESWDDSFGGHLELWNRDMTLKCKEISPLFNRCVVFNTDATSYHGHPEPLATPEGVFRRFDRSVLLHRLERNPQRGCEHIHHLSRPAKRQQSDAARGFHAPAPISISGSGPRRHSCAMRSH